jgi:hypothetical protein
MLAIVSWRWSERMACKMRQEQFVDLLRHLVGRIVSNTRQGCELVWRRDELARPLGCRPAYRVVVIAPDKQCWHPRRPHRLMMHATCSIPSPMYFR